MRWVTGRDACIDANADIGRHLSPKAFGDLSSLPSQVPSDSDGFAAGEHHPMRSIPQSVNERQLSAVRRIRSRTFRTATADATVKSTADTMW